MKEIWALVKKMDLRGLLVAPTQNGLLQFLRYCLVGGVATVVDWGILYLLTDFCGVYHLVSVIFAFIAGLLVNFLLSRALVFRANEARGNSYVEFISYAVIGVVGLGLTELIMYVFTNRLQLHYMLSKVIATLAVLVWNYTARKKLVYK